MLAAVIRIWKLAIGPLLGTRAQFPLVQFLFGKRIFLSVAMLPLVLGTAALILIGVIVDPYDIRPWGLEPRIADHRYPDTEWPLLINVVLQGDYQTVLLGASTVMAVTKQQMRRSFGSASKPINLSYPFAAPADLRISMIAVEKLPGLKRLIVVLDHSQMLGMEASEVPARMRDNVMSTNWAHAGDFTISTALASLNRIIYGVYDRPAWQDRTIPGFMEGKRPLTTDPKKLARIRVAVKKYRQTVLGTTDFIECGKFPFISKVFNPALVRLESLNVQVDIVFPPYLMVSYYSWIERRFTNDPFPIGAVYPMIISFKRCIVEAAEPFTDFVNVIAMDNDLSLTGKLSNYMDNIHIISQNSFQKIMNNVQNGKYLLTKTNFKNYKSILEKNILSVVID